MRGGTDSELSVLCSSHSNTQKPATDQSSYGVPYFQSCALLLGASSAASAYSTGCIHWAKLCLTIILANGRHFQMGSVHKHLVQFPMPDFNCSFTGEGVKIKTSIPAVKSPRTHSSQSSTGMSVKNGAQRILHWMDFISCNSSIQKFEWVSTTSLYKVSQPGASEDTCPDTQQC